MKENEAGEVAMNNYETMATVEDNGQVHLAGVPFEPGTKVRVTIEPTQNGEQATAAAPMPGAEDIFAEMRPYMVGTHEVDDSREAIYTRMEGE
jgi:hypothetical protein